MTPSLLIKETFRAITQDIRIVWYCLQRGDGQTGRGVRARFLKPIIGAQHRCEETNRRKYVDEEFVDAEQIFGAEMTGEALRAQLAASVFNRMKMLSLSFGGLNSLAFCRATRRMSNSCFNCGTAQMRMSPGSGAERSEQTWGSTIVGMAAIKEMLCVPPCRRGGVCLWCSCVDVFCLLAVGDAFCTAG